MSIITISRGSYSKGKEVAEKLAKKFGYECISRDIILEASEHFHIPEIRLKRAIHDSSSFLNRFTHGKEKYITYFEEAFLDHVRKDNVVYHGLAGHFFLPEISHVLKVRITAELKDRVKEEMRRENISADEARNLLIKDDDERRKWSHHLYGINTSDSSLYDIVLHIGKLTVDDVIEILQNTIQLPCFKTTLESQKALDDLYLAANVKTHLVNKITSTEVSAKDGVVVVTVEASLRQEYALTAKVKNIVGKIPGVKEVRLHLIPSLYF
jgi:cytidylate kinase